MGNGQGEGIILSLSLIILLIIISLIILTPNLSYGGCPGVWVQCSSLFFFFFFFYNTRILELRAYPPRREDGIGGGRGRGATRTRATKRRVCNGISWLTFQCIVQDNRGFAWIRAPKRQCIEMGNRRNVKVTPYMVVEIRREYAEGRTQPWLARKYGIGPGQIGRIVRGEAWTQITDGNPVTTEQDAQLRYLTTPGPSKEEAEASFAKVQRMLAQEQSVPGVLEILESRRAATTAASDYARMMAEAQVAADSRDGTQQIGEHVAARIEKTLADSRPAINAEKLLETLKDEQNPTNDAVAKGD